MTLICDILILYYCCWTPL